MQSPAQTLLSVTLSPAPAEGVAIPLDTPAADGPFQNVLGSVRNPASAAPPVAGAGSRLPPTGIDLPVHAPDLPPAEVLWTVELAGEPLADAAPSPVPMPGQGPDTALKPATEVVLLARDGRLLVPVDEPVVSLPRDQRAPQSSQPLLTTAPVSTALNQPPTGDSLTHPGRFALSPDPGVPVRIQVPGQAETTDAAANSTRPHVLSVLPKAEASASPAGTTATTVRPERGLANLPTVPDAAPAKTTAAATPLPALDQPPRRRGREPVRPTALPFRERAPAPADGIPGGRPATALPQDIQAGLAASAGVVPRPDRPATALRERPATGLPLASHAAASLAPGQRFVLTPGPGDLQSISEPGNLERNAIRAQVLPVVSSSPAAPAAPLVSQSPAAPAPAATTLPTFSVETPVLDPAWQTAVNERVVWMAGRNVQHAELRLSPAELGPVQVQVSVEDKAVSVSLSAAQAVTREALEGAMPRLRELLAENGMNLSGSDIGERGAGTAGREASAGQAGIDADRHDADVIDADGESASAGSQPPKGNVDFYA